MRTSKPKTVGDRRGRERVSAIPCSGDQLLPRLADININAALSANK